MSILIFHSPMPIDRPLLSGSSVRPKRMLEAFGAIDQEILLIDGDSRNRRRRWVHALAMNPDDLLGAYSELGTSPIALTDPDHLPRAPCMDARAFRSLRRRGIPVTAFYRDAYWRFGDSARSVAMWKRAVLQVFHRLEWLQLRRSIDHCFVPSLEMLGHLPPLGSPTTSALPPGGVMRDRAVPNTTEPRALRLFYVGGVEPPHYDMSAMFDAVDKVDGVELVICCRRPEWRRSSATYRIPRNAAIVHLEGESIDEMYQSCDAVIDWRPWSTYLSFASPIKTYEAIGWGLPLIANGMLPTGRLAIELGLGWGPDSPESLQALLQQLAHDRSPLEQMAARVSAARVAHTWEARARTVVDTLRAIREARR
jgi:hypothetical protein